MKKFWLDFPVVKVLQTLWTVVSNIKLGELYFLFCSVLCLIKGKDIVHQHSTAF